LLKLKRLTQRKGMDEVKYMRAYNKHSDMAMLILKKEGREKLQWLHDQMASQFLDYNFASTNYKLKSLLSR
jgi:hypothetical protein